MGFHQGGYFHCTKYIKIQLVFKEDSWRLNQIEFFQMNATTFYMYDDYRVALNFCGSLILRIGDFLGFVGTN